VSNRPRKKYFVDPKVQTALMVRVFTYWLACLCAVFLILAIVPMVVCLLAVDSPPPVWRLLGQTVNGLWPAFMASVLVLPFILGDCVRLSNRFVGPVIRLRRAMRELADGKPVEPVKFRDDDYWFDFAADFNRLAQRVQQSDVAQSDSTPRSKPPATAAKRPQPSGETPQSAGAVTQST
jgi:hypothetical protein